MICAACRVTRDPVDLLAFWPVGDPDRLRYVCRPTSRPSGVVLAAPCFGMAVGPASQHAIALVAPAPMLRVVAGPITPGTIGWARLMGEAGVRAA